MDLATQLTKNIKIVSYCKLTAAPAPGVGNGKVASAYGVHARNSFFFFLSSSLDERRVVVCTFISGFYVRLAIFSLPHVHAITHESFHCPPPKALVRSTRTPHYTTV